ncbi:MAG: PEP-CTERM sorting domain-containing protein [Acidobacteria bacterium]|nr:PEP-CTERM sorting domain-containing protein [Acidobacteriota bacterium]
MINVRVLPGSIGPAVPEPSTLLLLFTGLGALGALAIRRSRK